MSKKDDAIIEPRHVFFGNPNAPVTVMEFADYETKSVLAAHAVVKEILETYQDKVKFSFRHFPLRHRHQKAQKAAEAAVAAAQEGKFWEMHEVLLKNQRHLGTISLKSYAKEIGLANNRFLDELINGKYAWSVQDDLDEGIRMGVREIPTFFVNGEKLEGQVTVESLSAEIERAIQQGT